MLNAKDIQIQLHLNELKSFINLKDTESCKNYLDILDTTIKGNVFEHFLAELYKGNGFHVQIKGGRGDKGADLIVKNSTTTEDIAFIIQAKNHKTPLNKKDTFSELQQYRYESAKIYNCKRYRLISLNGFVNDAYDYQKKNWLALYNWKHIEELVFDYNATKKRKPSVDLRTHNKQTYEEICRLKKFHNHISIIQATGTGKSFLIYQIIADNHDKKILLIAPSKYIIQQFQNNEKYGWLMDGVKTLHYQNRQQFLDEHLENQKYDLIILDEFHRAGAKTFELKTKKLLAHNPNAFVLAATATPIRSDGRNMIEEFEFEAASYLTLPYAIVKEHIPKPTYVASLIDLEEEIQFVKKSLEQSKNPKIDKLEEAKRLDEIKLDWKKSSSVDKILKKYLEGSELRNFIVFCEDIQTLNKYKHRVSEWFVEAGFNDVEPFTVHSKKTDKENEEARSQFANFSVKNKIALLFAVDMFNEGLHIKNVDGVILLRKTTSHIVFYQQIGRCLQVGSKSSIIFDLVNNFSSVEANNFIKDLNEAKEHEQKELKEAGLEDDTPNFKVYDHTKDIREILEAIETKFQTWDFWFELLIQWKNDKVANKKADSHVPSKKIYKGYKLGFWYDNQRANKERILEIFPARYKKLIDYGIKWRDEPIKPRVTLIEALREKMPLLKKYYELNKNSNIPKRWHKKHEGQIFGWKKELANYVHHTLRPKYIARIEADKTLTCFDDGIEMPISDFLEKIKFNDKPKPRLLQLAINRLEKEHKLNSNFSQNDFEILIKKDKRFFSLIVNKLRGHINRVGKSGFNYFPPGELENLESLGFTRKTKNFDFNTMIERLERFVELYHKLPNSKSKLLTIEEQKNEKTLCSWVYEQKRIDCKLSHENKAKLLKLGVSFERKPMTELSKNKWLQKFHIVANSKNDFENYYIPTRVKGKYQHIGNWVLDQRKYCLEDWQNKMLSDIGFFDVEQTDNE